MGAECWAGAAFGYLSAKSGSVTNTLTPEAQVNPSITETFDGVVKQNVTVDVGNPGYAVYVRAAIVVTWQNAAGEIAAQMPVEDIDYTISLNQDDWFQKDMFYYHKTMVNAGVTQSLIVECKQEKAPPEGYQLHVEIIAQTIQALGTSDIGNIPAVTAAWGVSVDASKNLTP